MTADVSEKLAHDGRGFRINWIITALKKAHGRSVSGKLANCGSFPENLFNDGSVSGKLVHDNKCFRKIGS
jgi:hypothetical protein